MKNSAWIAVTALIALAALGTESAEAARRDRRQNHQGARIRQGVRSGELTQGEARAVQAQQGHVRRIERRAEADGVVTEAEKLRIEKAQDRSSRQIYRLKHNGQDRGAEGNGTAPAADAPTQE